MNEQYPTESIVSEPAEAFAPVVDSYAQSAQPAEAFSSTEHLAGFSSLSTPEPSPYLPNEVQDLAHMELPPLAQPLASTTLGGIGGLGSFAAADSWDDGSTAEIGSLPTEMNTPASPLPLQSFAAPETIDTAQRLSAPFSLPSLPSVSFPSGSQAAQSTFESDAAPLTASVESSPLLPPLVSGWEPQTPGAPASNTFPSLPAFGSIPAFSTAPVLPTEFPESAGFPASALPSASFPSAPAFPSAPMAFETPAFPAAPSFPSAPAFPVSFAPEQALAPQSFAAPEPFDAGDSFDPLPEIETYPNPQPNLQPSFQPGFPAPASNSAGPTSSPGRTVLLTDRQAGSGAPAASTDGANASPRDPFAGQVDFSSNPLPRPEALVLKQAEEPAKTSRFGRKKAAPTDLLAMGAAPVAAVASVAESAVDAANPGAKKAKRFGKKPAKTVDLLGAPLGARPLDATDSASGPLATNPPTVTPMTAASLPSLGLPVQETADEKPKRKLFARVDRSKEKPLTPNSGRARKMVQGLAAISLLAGAGLFTMSFLDKKSPAPTPSVPPVETSVAPAVVDPTATSTPVPTDPATGLPVPLGANPQAPGNPDVTQAPLGSGSVDTIASAPTADSTPLSPIDATPVPVDTTPGQDGQAPATTIAPGPNDLEFSTGGNFSE
jgi:hypothetical protein